MATYLPSQPRIQNPHSCWNFFAKIYATNLAELTFFNLICRLLRLEKRNEDGSEMASSSTKLFEASCVPETEPLNWLEQTEYDFFFMEAYFLNYNLSWNLTPPLSCCCYYLFLVPWCFEPKKKSILYRDVANVNRYTTTKQHVGKYCRHSIGLCPRGNSCQQAQEKVEKRGKIKASGITPYEHSELYNA